MNIFAKFSIAFVAYVLIAAMWVHMWVLKKIEITMSNKSKNFPLEEDNE